VAHEYLSSGNITITQAGYVYIYLSNESASQVEVYFDDLKVTQTKSPVIQREDFYPFGATFNSYQRESSVPNQYLFNQGTGAKTFNTERIYDLGLNVDESKYRTYDYLTGRWWQLDPLADEGNLVSLTPYNYSYNDPVRFNDPEGDCPPDEGPCSTSSEEDMAITIAATIMNGVKGVVNLALAPFDKELSEDFEMQDRQAPQTVGEAIMKPVQNGLDALSILPSSGPTSTLLAKTGPLIKSAPANILRTINGNSKLSQNAQTVYGLMRKGVEKVGLSGGKLDKTGIPYRANKQVNALNKVAGVGKYKAVVLGKVLQGKGARQMGLLLEKKLATVNKATINPRIHKRPTP
jgi:RHS repeat-associated protein